MFEFIFFFGSISSHLGLEYFSHTQVPSKSQLVKYPLSYVWEKWANAGFSCFFKKTKTHIKKYILYYSSVHTNKHTHTHTKVSWNIVDGGTTLWMCLMSQIVCLKMIKMVNFVMYILPQFFRVSWDNIYPNFVRLSLISSVSFLLILVVTFKLIYASWWSQPACWNADLRARKLKLIHSIFTVYRVLCSSKAVETA